MLQKEILFLGKKNDHNTKIAVTYLQNNFSNVMAFFGSWGDPFPDDLVYWSGDIIISYLSRWKIPKVLIDKTDLCINFHPGSNEYPGIGCLNFALYEEATSYGVCCHHMNEAINSGNIIAVDDFPILKSDTVTSLLSKTYAHQLSQFYRILDGLIVKDMLPNSSRKWTRKPFKHSEFEKLKIISPEMGQDEISRRIKAVFNKEYQPNLIVGEHSFIYQNDNSSIRD